MKMYLKQFVELATGLKLDPFFWARIKLTLLYTFIITAGIIFYLILLYSEFGREIQSFAKTNVPVARQKIFTKRSTIIARITLFTIQPEDIGMFFLTVVISYIFAGIALKPIKKTMLAQKQFLADASHELRTPLAIIRTEMEVFLRDKKTQANNKEFLLRERQSIIGNLEEIDRMQQIIDNLLLLSRNDSYQENFRFVKIDLYKIVSQVIQRLKESAKRKQVNFFFKTERKIEIIGDSIRLEQALLNIVKNAIKYTPKGGKVIVSVSENVLNAEISIIDTGIGIAEEDLPHVFKRFYRANNKVLRQTEGVGLGLTIADMIIKKHKGTIDIKSTGGKGTTVIVALPLAS